MKKRIRVGDPQRRKHWEELVRRWRRGGLGVRAFCRAEGVPESAFYFWRHKLAGEHAGGNGSAAKAKPAEAASRSVRQISRRHEPAPFLPVHVVQSDVTEAAGGVEIVLAHGRTIRVRSGFDRQTLADVLAVLEVRPC